MTAFNNGDKVVCVDASGTARLRTGEVYTVRVVDNGYIGLREFRELSPEWSKYRFAPVVKAT